MEASSEGLSARLHRYAQHCGQAATPLDARLMIIRIAERCQPS